MKRCQAMASRSFEVRGYSGLIAQDDESSGSDSSSTEEEERLRRLFLACDRDGDGLIDSQDLLHMCQLLNVKESVDDIMKDLGVDKHGHISFEKFFQHRTQLIDEIGVFLQNSEGTDNSLGMMIGNKDYDNNSKPLEPEGCHLMSLYELLECHEPEILQNYLEFASAHQNSRGRNAMSLLDIANSLHLAALSSLKGEVIELNNHMKRLQIDKEILEKQVAKHQVEKMRIQKDVEDRFEQQMVRYEDRITELHSVIAELRKKLDQRQIGVIQEEDEFEESDGLQSNKSNDADSLNDNTPNCSHTVSIADIGSDVNAELSKVVSELESAINTHKLTISSPDDLKSRISTWTSSLEDKAIQVSAVFRSEQSPSNTLELEKRVSDLELEKESVLEQSGRQEMELSQLKTQLNNIREERDKFKRKAHELHLRNQSLEAQPSSSSRATSSQSKTFPSPIDRSGGFPSSGATIPVAKVAELKRLKTGRQDRPVLGAEISSLGLPNAAVAEHLAHSMQESSSIQELLQSMQQSSEGEGGGKGGVPVTDLTLGKIQEFKIEMERLQSKVNHLKAQNDLLNITLAESKSHCDHLTVLLGKYESNNTALQMSLNYSDQALEICDVIVSLLDIELAILLAKCRASGLGNFDHQNSTVILRNAHQSRRTVEVVARQLLSQLDHNGISVNAVGSAIAPWEDLSSNSRTASTTSSTTSNEDAEFTKFEEQKLREHLCQLKADRAVVKLTILELESVHLDPFSYDLEPNPDAQRLDLENAVLMQELMAMKEEKAELKAQNYLLQKEKALLELKLNSRQSQPKGKTATPTKEHLQNDDADETKILRDILDADVQKLKRVDSPKIIGQSVMPNELPYNTPKISLDLADAQKREASLKAKVEELTTMLDKLSKSSDIKHQQSAGFVNELKRANSALVCAFEKAKKKYMDKMKKMEVHLQVTTERYETQLEMMQQKMMIMENELRCRQTPGLSSL